MITSIKKLTTACGFGALIATALFSCAKDNDKILDPGQKALFLSTSGTYNIETATTVFKIPVGLTTPVTSGKTRTVNITATSATGAVEGTHYTYTKTLTFSPDKIVDTIVVTGVQALYLDDRKDVIRFTFADATDTETTLPNTYTLNMYACSDVIFGLDDLLGDYANTIETFGTGAPYGPYTTTVTSATSTGPTSATIVVSNIWNAGWEPLTFNLDWSNPRGITAIVQPNSAIAGSNAGDINSAYDGETIQVRSHADGAGTFSICSETITLRMQLGVTDRGFFGSLYTVEMAR